MNEVTHPADGIYLSKFMAGVLSSVLGVALVGAFVNLWQLNSSAILFNAHLSEVRQDSATLPGAVSRNEWNLERLRRDDNYKTLTAQLDLLAAKLDRLNEKVN